MNEALDFRALELLARVRLAEAASTAQAQATVANIRSRFAAEWHAATQRFRAQAGRVRAGVDPLTGRKLSADELARATAGIVAELERSWQKTILRHWQASWKLGFAARGKLPPDTTLQIQIASPRFKATVEGQMAAAARFAQELAAGVPNQPGRMPYAVRSAMYASAVQGAFGLGAVDGGPPGELIEWRLGAAERHCLDCPLIAANGPYTRDTLPTWPRSGGTQCRSRCLCSLVFLPPKPGTPAPTQPDGDPDDIVSRALADPPQPPVGWRAPTPTERDLLRDLEARLNFARRQIAMHPPDSAEQRRWIRTRRDINRELREFTERERIHHVPTFSVPEVITGADITATQVTEIVTARGADGATVAVAKRAVRPAAAKATEDAAPRLKRVPPTTPPAPSTAAIRRALAPPEPDAEEPEEEALEAVGDAGLPSAPLGQWTVNVVGQGARHTAALVTSLLVLVGNAAPPYAVEIGPLDEDWLTLALELGIWIRGHGLEVERLLADWRKVAPRPAPAVAPYLG